MKKYNINYNIRGLTATMMICAKQVFDGNPLQVAAEYLVRFVQFGILILVWRSLAAAAGVTVFGY